ncbi:hypothetical protein, partial [Nocardia seriolae]
RKGVEMAWRTRIFEVPGGLLELRSAGAEDENYGGFYLEFSGSGADSIRDELQRGTDMRYRATALGYPRIDVSGIGQLWDESQIRRLAERFGYDFSGMVIYDPASGRPPLARLKTQATRLDAEAVIVPGPEHFEGGEVPGSPVRQLDVITVHPEQTFARRTIPPLSDLPPATADGVHPHHYCHF